jgi:hypothetical protein
MSIGSFGSLGRGSLPVRVCLWASGPPALPGPCHYPHLERPLLRGNDGASWPDAFETPLGLNDAYLRRNTFSRSSLPVTALGQLPPIQQPQARFAASPAPPAPRPSPGRGLGESLGGSAGSSRCQQGPLSRAKWLSAAGVGDGSGAQARVQPGSGQVQAWG